MSIKDMNRQVHYIYAPAFQTGDTSGINNTWIYVRAPDGYIFELHHVEVQVGQYNTLINGIFGIFDGHEYTHWNMFPGVESREIIGRAIFNSYQLNASIPLFGWECKEYTIGVRSSSASAGIKLVAILFYTLKKASRNELLEYALKHPFNPDAFKRALRGTTIDPSEA